MRLILYAQDSSTQELRTYELSEASFAYDPAEIAAPELRLVDLNGDVVEPEPRFDYLELHVGR